MYPPLKRILDILFVFVVGLLTLPLLFFAVLSILIFDRETPIFKQKRIGKEGRPFTIYKLRTMRSDAPASVPTRSAADSWITPVGKILRRSNVDELPQLWCILVGSMSFIGFRPGLAVQSELHTFRTELGVYQIRPGLSGLAQLRGYDDMPDNEKAEHDRQYVENISLWTDMKIFAGTFLHFFKKPPKY